MSMLATAARLANLATSGEFDKLVGPLGALLDTLAFYPSPAKLPRVGTREELVGFLTRHAVIDRALRDAVQLIAALPLWDDKSDAGDLPDDCLAGLESWSADLSEAIRRHPAFDEKVEAEALAAAARKLAEAEALAATRPDDELSIVPPVTPSPGAVEAFCPCGQPATAEIAGIDVCASCAAAAGDLLTRLGVSP